MADTKISALTAAGSAATSNEIPINEGGTTKKVTVAQIASAILPVKAAGSDITTGTDDAKFLTSKALADATVGKLGAAWTDWTPTWTNFTPGSATIVAKYTQIGKTVHFFLSVTLNGSTMGTGPAFSLPVTAASTFPVATTLGQLYWLDAGTEDGQGFISLTTTSNALLRTYASNATYGGYAPFSSTVPIIWANSDKFIARGTYEAA
jgi:hypothetical protein